MSLNIVCIVLAFIAVTVIGLVTVSPMLFPSSKIKTHRGISKEAFIAHFVLEGIPEVISSAVYDFYKRKSMCKEFSPSPDMDINGIFDEESEDIDDTARHLLKELMLKYPSKIDENSWSFGQDIRTIAELIRWVNWVSNHQS